MESQRYLHKCHVQLLFVQAARALMKLKHHAPQCLPLMPGYRKCFQGGLYLTISACEMDRTFLVWLDCESDQRLSHPRVVNKFNTNYIIFFTSSTYIETKKQKNIVFYRRGWLHLSSHTYAKKAYLNYMICLAPCLLDHPTAPLLHWSFCEYGPFKYPFLIYHLLTNIIQHL
jgi:hypothetical protein